MEAERTDRVPDGADRQIVRPWLDRRPAQRGAPVVFVFDGVVDALPQRRSIECGHRRGHDNWFARVLVNGFDAGDAVDRVVFRVVHLDKHVLAAEVLAHASDDCDVLPGPVRRHFERVPVQAPISNDAEVAVLDQFGFEDPFVIVTVTAYSGFDDRFSRSDQISVYREREETKVAVAQRIERHCCVCVIRTDALDNRDIRPCLRRLSVDRIAVRIEIAGNLVVGSRSQDLPAAARRIERINVQSGGFERVFRNHALVGN